MAFNWGQLLNQVPNLLGLFGGQQPRPPQQPQNPVMGALGQLGSGLTSLITPQNALGAGLLGAGVLSDKEPGEVLEARQFLRNQFTSPTAFGDLMKQNVGNTQTAFAPILQPGAGQNFLTGQLSQSNTNNIMQQGPGQQFVQETFSDPNAISRRFAGQVSGLQSQFQPLLDQQRQRGIDDIQQRFAAAFPSTVGAQGSEFGTLARYITDEAAPREQAFLGELGLNALGQMNTAATNTYQDEAGLRNLRLGQQQQAANSLLSNEQNIRDLLARSSLGALDTQIGAANTLVNSNQRNPLSELSSLLGYDLLTRGQGGQTGALGQGSGQGSDSQGQGGVFGNQLPSPQQIGQLSPSQLAQQLAQGGDLTNLGQLLMSGALAGTPFPYAVQAGTPMGQLVQQAISRGLVESPAAQVVGQGAGQAAGGGGFLASGAGTALGAVGSAAGGYFAGRGVGDLIEQPNSSATQLKTTVGGAAGGAAAGAAIGSIVPGLGTALGAIIGGLGGAFGGFGAERRREDAQTARETAETNAARPAAIQLQGSIVQNAGQTAAQLDSLDNTVGEWLKQNENDPAVAPLMAELRTLYGATNRSTWPTFNPISQTASWLREQVSSITNPNPNREGTNDLLQSTETGRFGPGVSIIQQVDAEAQRRVGLINQLVALVQSRMGGG